MQYVVYEVVLDDVRARGKNADMKEIDRGENFEVLALKWMPYSLGDVWGIAIVPANCEINKGEIRALEIINRKRAEYVRLNPESQIVAVLDTIIAYIKEKK